MKKLIALLLFLLYPAFVFGAVGNLVNATTLTITTGGVWQKAFPVATNRSTLWIENPCSATSQGIGSAEDLYVSFSTAAPSSITSGGVFDLAACGSIVMTPDYVSQQAVWVYATTTSHAFLATQSQ